MSEMKWIKIVTDIIDDEKMLMIEMMCKGSRRDTVQLLWFETLALAGKLNEGGRLTVNGIPMDEKALAKKFRRAGRTVAFAFDMFIKLGMVTRDEDGAFCVVNWSRYQSDMSEKADKSEYDKKRYQEKKAKADEADEPSEKSEKKVKKSENSTFFTGQNKNKNKNKNISSSSSLSPSSKKEGEEEEEEEEEEEKNELVDRIVDSYNRICTSYPKVETITAARRNMVIQSMKELHAGVADYVKIFTYAHDNDFLKGQDGKKTKNWKPSFDWLINPQNATRVLEGCFFSPKQGGNGGNYDAAAFEQELIDRVIAAEV